MLGRYTVGRFAQTFFCIRDTVTNAYLRKGDVGEEYKANKILLFQDYICAKRCCNQLNKEVEENGTLRG